MSNENTTQQDSAVQALPDDKPQTDIKNDAFGYAPFAQTIAKAVQNLHKPQGQILAIHGPWGSGKTSFLNFVKHYLRPENIGADEKDHAPIVIDFNPWWFAGHEQLAGQLLAQFAAQLPSNNDRFKQIKADLGKYAGLIGGLVSVAGTLAFIPVALTIGAAVSEGLKHSKTETKDIPTLKKELANALEKANQRFLVVIDDIDRLEPKEIRELFKVLKALADFPNVVYLLAFDREMVAQALGNELNIDGHAWLEKIVQAPFALPKIMPEKLKALFFSRVSEVMGDSTVFDPFWKGIPPPRAVHESTDKFLRDFKVYEEGFKYLIQTPRDLVRLVGSLSVTYPAVRGQVNPLHFLILECLRIFHPAVYVVLRDRYDDFIKPSIKSSDSKPHRINNLKAFKTQVEQSFVQWEKDKPPAVFAAINNLLRVLGFTYAEGLDTSGNFVLLGGETVRHEQTLCKLLNPVSDKNRFSAYFQFGVLP